ncbi:hypothetical protein RJ639_018902 [Escallonia herrerae]|uniref:Retroviral polymerase SH3-like domain-containing protein n=1 Tax=Escallonia herrerae TaxID=1293975 RepID=A0AA88V7S0_9ASTE|nr:hypothetical protein RJ639_018902 [Escallonia herrerae]
MDVIQGSPWKKMKMDNGSSSPPSPVFAHVRKEQLLKLDDKAIPCVFLGHGDTQFVDIGYGNKSKRRSSEDAMMWYSTSTRLR